MTDASGRALQTDVPHSARMYDYYLGGKDWFEADRQTAEQVLQRFPTLRTFARANRAFMHRATRTLAREQGVRQFLDLGSGIPTEPNLHQVAQAERPDARVVYLDNDPLVIEYTDVLTRGTPEGRTAYVEADVRTDDVLADPRVREVLDLDEPVALSLVALLHFFADEDRPHERVRGLLDRLPTGSFLVLTHITDDFGNEEDAREVEGIYRAKGTHTQARSRTEIARFFDGLELLAPGLCVAHRWRPDAPVTDADKEVGCYSGVARTQ